MSELSVGKLKYASSFSKLRALSAKLWLYVCKYSLGFQAISESKFEHYKVSMCMCVQGGGGYICVCVTILIILPVLTKSKAIGNKCCVRILQSVISAGLLYRMLVFHTQLTEITIIPHLPASLPWETNLELLASLYGNSTAGDLSSQVAPNQNILRLTLTTWDNTARL